MDGLKWKKHFDAGMEMEMKWEYSFYGASSARYPPFLYYITIGWLASVWHWAFEHWEGVFYGDRLGLCWKYYGKRKNRRPTPTIQCMIWYNMIWYDMIWYDSFEQTWLILLWEREWEWDEMRLSVCGVSVLMSKCFRLMWIVKKVLTATFSIGTISQENRMCNR